MPGSQLDIAAVTEGPPSSRSGQPAPGVGKEFLAPGQHPRTFLLDVTRCSVSSRFDRASPFNTTGRWKHPLRDSSSFNNG